MQEPIITKLIRTRVYTFDEMHTHEIGIRRKRALLGTTTIHCLPSTCNLLSKVKI